MIGYRSSVETAASQDSIPPPHAVPPLLSGPGGAVSGTATA
jgi:hypothetical protein